MNLAYVAGFFDGEGCVNFSRTRSSVFPRVLITNTDREILEDIQRQFGGDIKTLSHRERAWKRGYCLRISWSAAVDFLNCVEPFLRLKKRQAHTVFAWDAIRLGRGKSTKVAREQYADSLVLLLARMAWLNCKGPSDGSPDPISHFL